MNKQTFKIRIKDYRLMLNFSLAGLILWFVYYNFLVYDYPKYQIIFDFIGYVSLIVFVLSTLLRVLKKVE